LVEIGSIVSEEKIFLNFIPPNFEIADFDRLCKLEKRGMKLKKNLLLCNY
jgi:hypothetical protein